MQIRHASVEIDGAKLRDRRKYARLSISELARRVGFTPNYIGAIERCQRLTVPPATYGKICDALGITDPDELVRDGLVRKPRRKAKVAA